MMKAKNEITAMGKATAILSALTLVALGISLSACKKKEDVGPMEELGKKMDEKMDKVGKKIDEQADKVEKKIEGVGKEIEEGAKKVKEKVADGADKVSEKLRDNPKEEEATK